MYSNNKIDTNIKIILDNAISLVQKSELYDSSYKYNIILCYNSFNNKIDDQIFGNGPAAKTTLNDVKIKELEVKIEGIKIDKLYEIGDVLRLEITPKDFGRIAAQTAKQVVIQRIKDAERDVIYDDFINRENEIITGLIQRISKNNVFIDLG